MALAHMLCGTAKGKDLGQGLREAMPLALRIIGRYEALQHVDETLDLHVCP